MEQGKTITKVAGVDVSKRWLDAAVHQLPGSARFDNTEPGWASLIAWLGERGVARVGLEATGGYERKVAASLAAAGFSVIVHQPLEVRLFARLKRKRAKTDDGDACIIAAATAQSDTFRAAADPLLADLAERLTAYEQAADMLAQAKTHREHASLADLKHNLEQLILVLKARKKALLDDLIARIRLHAHLARRFELLMSLPGVGKTIAAVLLVRMPELGSMQRGQAGALLGVAPYTRESGQWKGHAMIAGGRMRPRRFLYLAALAARRVDIECRAFCDGLAKRGKPPKVVLIALTRKLIEAANLILKRNQEWMPTKPIPAS
jgi:transposase